MPDDLFDDPFLASFYDRTCTDRGDETFYLDLMHSAGAVLDVGCGTGALLHRARADGHSGRLVGLDPAAGMLAQARKRSDIEWVQGVIADAARWRGEFDLVYMTGHAFQVLLTDDDVRAGFTAVRAALAHGGHFAFETRNPLVRAWESWTPEDVDEISDDDGNTVRIWHEVLDVDGKCVTFTETFDCPAWHPSRRVSRSTLRFLPAGRLDQLLVDTGLTVHERYGFWDRRPFSPDSREIITVCSVSPS